MKRELTMWPTIVSAGRHERGALVLRPAHFSSDAAGRGETARYSRGACRYGLINWLHFPAHPIFLQSAYPLGLGSLESYPLGLG